MPAISQKAQAELNKLHDQADAARKAYVKALQQHRTNTVQVDILRGQSLAAKRDYIAAYREAGFSRQSAWMADKVSRGLCRLCGNKALPKKKHCETHEAWLHSPVRKKKLVQP